MRVVENTETDYEPTLDTHIGSRTKLWRWLSEALANPALLSENNQVTILGDDS